MEMLFSGVLWGYMWLLVNRLCHRFTKWRSKLWQNEQTYNRIDIYFCDTAVLFGV